MPSSITTAFCCPPTSEFSCTNRAKGCTTALTCCWDWANPLLLPPFSPFNVSSLCRFLHNAMPPVLSAQAGKRLRSQPLWKTEAKPPRLARKLHYGASPAMVFPQKSGGGQKMRRAKIFFRRNNLFRAAILFRPVCVRVPLFRSVCSRNLL